MTDASNRLIRYVALEEIQSYATVDPAVQSGLLLYEIRPWITVMEHE